MDRSPLSEEPTGPNLGRGPAELRRREPAIEGKPAEAPRTRKPERDREVGQDPRVGPDLARGLDDGSRHLHEWRLLERHRAHREVPALEPAGRRQQHIRAPSRATAEHVHARQQLEVVECIGQTLASGDRAQRIAGDHQHRPDPFVPRLEDLVREHTPRQRPEQRGEPSDAAAVPILDPRPPVNPLDDRPRWIEHRASASIEVAGDERQRLQQHVAQRPEPALVDADRHVKRGRRAGVDPRRKPADRLNPEPRARAGLLDIDRGRGGQRLVGAVHDGAGLRPSILNEGEQRQQQPSVGAGHNRQVLPPLRRALGAPRIDPDHLAAACHQLAEHGRPAPFEMDEARLTDVGVGPEHDGELGVGEVGHRMDDRRAVYEVRPGELVRAVLAAGVVDVAGAERLGEREGCEQPQRVEGHRVAEVDPDRVRSVLVHDPAHPIRHVLGGLAPAGVTSTDLRVEQPVPVLRRLDKARAFRAGIPPADRVLPVGPELHEAPVAVDLGDQPTRGFADAAIGPGHAPEGTAVTVAPPPGVVPGVTLRALSALLCPALLATTLTACDAGRRVLVVDEEFALGDLTELDLDQRAGDLVIVGEDDSDAVRLVVELRTHRVSNARDEDAKDALRVGLEREGIETGRILAGLHHPPAGYYVDVTVFVPSKMHMRVEDGSGDLAVENLASLRLDDDSGDIDIAQIAGDLVISDDSGDLVAEHIGGHVHIDDASGDIEVADVGGDVEVDDRSGDMVIEHVDGTVTIDDRSGDIVVAGAKDVNVRSDSSGDVTIR